MKKFNITAVAVLCAASLGSLTALAEPGGDKPRKAPDRLPFEKMDTDGDGVVSKDEFLKAHTERLEQLFARLDKNTDGKITKDEIPPPRDPKGDRRGPKRECPAPVEAQPATE